MWGRRVGQALWDRRCGTGVVGQALWDRHGGEARGKGGWEKGGGGVEGKGLGGRRWGKGGRADARVERHGDVGTETRVEESRERKERG